MGRARDDQTAAVELAAKNIRCNSVHPGIIQTKLLNSWTKEHFESRVANIPMKRAGTVRDVAKLVLFLLSDDASYITGAEVTVDGGLGL
jgi:3alpha(or 20beta)-hydroxysteroid dehydrogenase